MTSNKIFIHDLHCYEVASEEQRNHRLVSPDRYFDLSKLPTEGLRKEMCDYIYHRGHALTLLSLRTEFWPYNVLCKFLKDRYARLGSILDEDLDVLIRKLRGWMLSNGYNLTKKSKSPQYSEPKICNSDVISYLKRFYEYMEPKEDVPETEKDKWVISKLNIPVNNSPVNPTLSLNFTSIVQRKLREEVKAASKMGLTYLAVQTVGQQIRAVKRFSEFLKREYPQVESLTRNFRRISDLH